MFKEKRELLKKLRNNVQNEQIVSFFDAQIETYCQQESDTIPLKSLASLHPKDVSLYTDCSEAEIEAGKKAIHHVAILKLNGGLGTTMGCEGPKSLITIKPGFTFLDCISKQILFAREQYKCQIPFLLLNSKATSGSTKLYLDAQFNMEYEELFQVNYPRFFEESMEPCKFEGSPEKEWAPGGHGDVYTALYISGILEKLLSKGIYYLFLSNSDNLGAELDLKILGYMVNQSIPFMMEVTPRTVEDIKGGTVVRYRDKITLIERAQVHENELKQFEDITRFPIFNTNNIWVDLRALLIKLKNKQLNLPVIANKKVVDEHAVVQLETAMGAAVQCFENSRIIVVPRSRFLPVKTTNDLLLIRSDLFEVSPEGHVFRNPKRRSPILPKIELDPECYGTVEKFEALFEVVPSLVEANSFKVLGPKHFDTPCVVKGSIVFENKTVKS